MKELVNELVKAVPNVLNNTQVTISLSGTPAAVAIGLVCSAGVVIYGLYSWEMLEEKKLAAMSAEKSISATDSESPKSKELSIPQKS